jgi:hypothetical protein
MVDRLDPQRCPHFVKNLRICSMYPEKYYECEACGAMFLQQMVLALDLPGSTDRMKALVRALAGLTADETPLEGFLYPGISLRDAWPLWPTGRIRVVEGGPQVEVEDAEPEPRWGRAS